MTDVFARTLFVERASAVDDSLCALDDERATVEEICRRLDGIPLAIELAAGRMRSSTARELLERIDDRFGLLQGRPHRLPARHRTMRATVEWSYRLLNAPNRRAFDRASVFVGGFEVDAAHAVLLAGDDRADAQAVLDELVDMSMVTVDRRDGHVRFRLLETLRQYGQERLEAAGNVHDVRRQHLRHYLGVAEWAGHRRATSDEAEANRIFDLEWPNIRAALRWAVDHDLDAAESLIAATGPYAEASRRYEHGQFALGVLSARGDGAGRAVTHGWAALPLFFAHDFARSRAIAADGIAHGGAAEETDTLLCRTAALHSLMWSGPPERSGAEASTLAVIAERSTDPFVRSLAMLAVIEEAFWRDATEAVPLVAGYATWAESTGVRSIRSMASFCAGRVCMWARDPPDVDGAIRAYRAGLRLAHHAGDVGGAHANFIGLAFASLSSGRRDAAALGRAALAQAHAAKEGHATRLLLDAIADWFVTIGAVEAAAVLSGHLLPADAPLGGRCHAEDRRRRLETHPAGPDHLACGAVLSSSDVVAYALRHLASASPTGNGVSCVTDVPVRRRSATPRRRG
jgi:non-specific serine/threonine protein kinase